MPLYKFTQSDLIPVTKKTFRDLSIRERDDLQRVLRDNIEAVSPDTLIIAEEYSNWQDSQRRIDLLGIDPDGTLVVIELKRTEDGGHMDLQAIRYAAMVSNLTFDQAVEALTDYYKKLGRDEDAKDVLLEHISCNPEDIGEATRIVLVSADYSSELTTCVMWLNQQGLNVSCVRLVAYQDGDSIYFDAQQIIPLPEASDYMVKTREKNVEKRVSKASGSRDWTRFVVSQNGKNTEPLYKRHAMFEIVSRLVKSGVSPEEIQKLLGPNRFLVCDGTHSSAEDISKAEVKKLRSGKVAEVDSSRFFTDDEHILQHGDKTYLFTHQWGANTQDLAEKLIQNYPESGLEVSVAENETD